MVFGNNQSGTTKPEPKSIITNFINSNPHISVKRKDNSPTEKLIEKIMIKLSIKLNRKETACQPFGTLIEYTKIRVMNVGKTI